MAFEMPRKKKRGRPRKIPTEGEAPVKTSRPVECDKCNDTGRIRVAKRVFRVCECRQ